MGGKKIYLDFETESGISLKASGFKHVDTTKAVSKGKGWTNRKRIENGPKVHSLNKYRWERTL